MKKKTHPTHVIHFSNVSTTAKTIFLAGFLLIAFALFLSQATPIFAKAALAPDIRGTLVLTDKGYSSSTQMQLPQTVMAAVSLPGSSCPVVMITACASGSSGGIYGSYGRPELSIDGTLYAAETTSGDPCTYYTVALVPGPHYFRAGKTVSGSLVHYMSLAYSCKP
ncbi:hypothetical protein HYV43_05560 [Candidatus Micrarchaeota archaeon]|nr:hypothetical protein [Candidatus Micrarchaeota archaeon]